METGQISNQIENAKNDLKTYVADGEQYVRQNPTKSVMIGLGTGFLLAQLPIRFMVFASLKLLLLLVKPATFIYAVSKLVDDVRGNEPAR
ncbi:MAG: DUF883 C-terminal domain-containing protein [Verrucomicrobiota bacterium]|nr:DUF883 C-terminal domain-containing protein [Verrucomicrobiota bacterium]